MNIPQKNHLLLFGALGLTMVAICIVPLRQKLQPSLLQPSHLVQNSHDIETVAFSKYGNLVVVANSGEAGRVTFWNTDGQRKQQWKADGDSIYPSPDGRHLLTTIYQSQDQSTHCTWYDALTGRALHRWTTKGIIYDVARDLSVAVSASSSQSGQKRTTTVRLVDVPTGKGRRQLVIPKADVWSVRFSRDAHYLRIPGLKGSAHLIRLSDWRSVLPLPPLENVNISPDGRTVTGLSQDGTLHFWQLPSRQHSSMATGLHHAQWFYRLGDGRLVVNGEIGQGKERKDLIQIRSPDGIRLVRTIEGRPDVISPTGQRMAFKVSRYDARGYTRGEAAYYDIQNVATGQSLAHLDVSSDPLGNDSAQSSFVSPRLAFSPDERHIVYTTNDGLMRFYDLQKGGNPAHGPISSATGHPAIDFQQNLLDAVVFPDGKVAASGTDDQGHHFVRVRGSSGTVSNYSAAVGNSDVSVLGVSPDGKTLVGSSQWGVWILDVNRGQGRETPISSGTNGDHYYSLHPTGRPVWLEGPSKPFSILSTGDFGEGPVALAFWDRQGKAQNTKIVVPSNKREGNSSFELASGLPSPDGHKLALVWNGVQRKMENGKPANALTGGGLIEVRNTATGQVLSRLEISGRNGAFGNPVWSSDAARLAMSDELGRVIIWDAASGRQVGQLSGTRANIDDVWSSFAEPIFGKSARLAFTPDGRFLAAGREDGSIYLYSLHSFLPVAQIGKAPAQLKWMQFSPDGRTLYGIENNGKSVLSWDVPRLNK